MISKNNLRNLGVVWFFSLLASCGTDENKDDKQQNGDTLAGWEEICGELVYESVDWDEVTEMGISAAEVFAPIEGTCKSTVSWDTGSMGTRTAPKTGESEITVALAIDRDSVALGGYAKAEASGESQCEVRRLKAEADASLVTADGVFDDSGKVEVSYILSEGEGRFDDIRLKKTFEEMGGSFSVELAEDESDGSMTYRFGGAGEACAGVLLMQVARSLGNGVASDSMGEIGGWSNTGCPLGTNPLALDEPLDGDTTLLERYDEIWGDRTFDATWDNGATTRLHVAVEMSETTGCEEQLGVRVPARITYGTNDGMLEERTVDGYAGLTLTDDGLMRAASVEITDDRFCDRPNDDIGYGFGDCTELSGVTIQLRMAWYDGDEWSVSDDALITYEYEVDTAPGTGADNTRELSLSL